jgi:hypothetical protein
MAHLHYGFASFSGSQHLIRLGDGRRDRFLYQHRDSRFQELTGNTAVRDGWNRETDRVQLFDKRSKVSSELNAELCRNGFSACFVDIADADQACVGVTRVDASVFAPEMTGPNYRNFDRLAHHSALRSRLAVEGRFLVHRTLDPNLARSLD